MRGEQWIWCREKKRGRQRVVNTAWGRNLECEMTNAIAQPTTRTRTAWSYDKAECIPLWGGLTHRLGLLGWWLSSSQWVIGHMGVEKVYTCVMVNWAGSGVEMTDFLLPTAGKMIRVEEKFLTVRMLIKCNTQGLSRHRIKNTETSSSSIPEVQWLVDRQNVHWQLGLFW